MNSVIVIVASGLTAMGFSATVVLALGRMAARADRAAERLLAEHRGARLESLRRR